MPAPIVAYLGSAATLLVLDVIWITSAIGWLYRPHLGDRLLDQPNILIAGLFYLFYALGIVVFAVLPAVQSQSLWFAVGLGALLGLVAYGTYDITNLATLRGWSALVSVVDLGWGMIVTASAAAAGYLAVRWLAT